MRCWDKDPCLPRLRAGYPRKLPRRGELPIKGRRTGLPTGFGGPDRRWRRRHTDRIRSRDFATGCSLLPIPGSKSNERESNPRLVRTEVRDHGARWSRCPSWHGIRLARSCIQREPLAPNYVRDGIGGCFLKGRGVAPPTPLRAAAGSLWRHGGAVAAHAGRSPHAFGRVAEIQRGGG